MANDPKQNDFAARLARIEKRQTAAAPEPARKAAMAKPGTVSRQSYQTSAISDGEDVRLRNGIIWACIFGVIGGAGYYGYQGLPEEYKDLVGLGEMAEAASELGTGLGALSIANGPDRGRDAPVRAMYRDGPALQTPALLTADGYDHDVQIIAADFTPTTGDVVPQNVMVFDRNDTCTLRRPQAGERVVNVRMAEGSMESAVLAFPDANIADWMTSYASDIAHRGRDRDITPFVADKMQAVDVFLTDTAAPLYVVLQNTSEGTIWNLQPADGVQIAHVAVIGPHASGFAGIQPQTTYEALQFTDFARYRNENWDILDGGCMAVPLRPRNSTMPQDAPQQDNRMTALVVEVDSALGDMVAERNEEKDAQLVSFETWYMQTLGVPADTNLVSANHAAHVLAGPMPSAPYPYRSIAASDVYVMRADNILAGPTEARTTAVIDMKLSLLEAATGGNTDWANPPMMEVVTQ